MKDNFKFWVPLDNLQKAFDKNGKEIMKIGGIASTSAKDTDGEFLDPNGFNLDYFNKQGFLNYHHQTKNNPSAIIGEPTKTEIRPEGLYVEGILYPDSELAKSVYDTAKILEKNSDNRRLGFSIEGKATKRKSNDDKHPDYKIIQKADITGCAITFSPKNPKTFMDIIKGNVDNSVEEYDDETMDLIKALEAGSITGRDSANISVPGNGSALKTEEKKVKLKSITNLEEDSEKDEKKKKLTKAEVYEQIFAKQPDISLLDAEKVFHYINKINMKQEIGTVDLSDVEKALSLLDKAQDLVKGGAGKEKKEDEDEDEVPKYSKDDDEEDSVKKANSYCETTMKKGKKSKSDAMSKLIEKGGFPADMIKKAFGKKDKDEEEDSDEEKVKKFKKKKAEVDAMEKALIEKGIMSDESKKEKDEKEKKEKEKVEKAIADNLKKEGDTSFDLEKGLDDVRELIKEKNYSVGVILKGIYDEMNIVKGVVNSIKEENADLKKALDESKDTINGLEGKITDLNKALDEPPVGRKSVQNSQVRERNFNGNQNQQDLSKANEGKQISVKERKRVLDILDAATFEKGFDAEFSEAMTTFESIGQVNGHIVSRLSKERGILLTQ